MSNLWQRLNRDMTDTFDDIRQSLVQIQNGDGSIGAGTIWHSDGLILTNAHVIMDQHRQRDHLQVVLPNDEVFPVTVIAHDRRRDLGALAIDTRDLPTITPGDSRTAHPGQWVMAVGHPWGMVDSLTSGVIVGSGGDLPEQFDGREWLALSLKLRPGHSGGPLVDVHGNLIGINTMITGPNVGFAIPVHIVKAFLKETIGNVIPPDADETETVGEAVVV